VLADPQARPPDSGAGPAALGQVLAPMGGKVLEVHVAPGDAVKPGQLLFVLESMKMQFEINAPGLARVEAVLVQPGQVLQGPEPLARLGPG
jgi:biotin carboxyl carrier protein